MATTRLIPMHCIRGQTTAHTIKERINYVTNPDKTQDQALVRTYGCDPNTAAAEMLLTKQSHAQFTGQSDDKTSDVLLYQIRQSFKPGEITPELALDIGYKLAQSFTKGKHQFIVTTHTDKAHIHNHIIFNATSMDAKRKFRNFLGSSKAIRTISDRLCLENGLSIIENPSQNHKHYGKWLNPAMDKPYKVKIKLAIDKALTAEPKDFDALIDILSEAGFHYKDGHNPGFISPGQKRYTSLKSLGKYYHPERLHQVLSGTAIHVPFIKTTKVNQPKSYNLILDLQDKILAKKGPGYEQWAKVFNLKQMAQTLNYLSEQNLTSFELLEAHVRKITQEHQDLTAQIKALDNEIADLKALKKHIVHFAATKKIYTEYQASGYSADFYEMYRGEILLHQAAKQYFKHTRKGELPSTSQLNSKVVALVSFKKQVMPKVNATKNDLRKASIVCTNCMRLVKFSIPPIVSDKMHR